MIPSRIITRFVHNIDCPPSSSAGRTVRAQHNLDQSMGVADSGGFGISGAGMSATYTAETLGSANDAKPNLEVGWASRRHSPAPQWPSETDLTAGLTAGRA